MLLVAPALDLARDVQRSLLEVLRHSIGKKNVPASAVRITSTYLLVDANCTSVVEAGRHLNKSSLWRASLPVRVVPPALQSSAKILSRSRFNGARVKVPRRN